MKKNHEKYLYILNSFFTVKKNYFEVFWLCAEFEVSLTPATGLLPIDIPFLTNMWQKYFSSNIWTVFHQSELKFSNLDPNWAKNRLLLLTTLDVSNCVDSCIVHWRTMLITFGLVFTQILHKLCKFFAKGFDCENFHVLPNSSPRLPNIFTWIYPSYLWHFATLPLFMENLQSPKPTL